MRNVKIRPIDPLSDLTDLKAFLDSRDAARFDVCLQAVADGDAFVLVAEDGGHVVGYATVHVRPRADMGWQPQGGTLAWLEAGDAYLEGIEVKTGLRSQGVGSLLHRKMEDELLSRGKAQIWCHTGETNVGAQRFYERNGWVYQETLQVPWQPVGRLSRIYCKQLKTEGHSMTTARIFQINSSAGGVPKLPIHEGQVTELGLVSDKHTDPSHGGLERALCIYSLEQILLLQEAGHPIFPGSTGENLTLAGLVWDEIKPGVQLRLGAEVCIEITSYTSPCHKIKASFSGGDFMRMSQKEHPGWARVYARVLQGGILRISDVVTVECTAVKRT